MYYRQGAASAAAILVSLNNRVIYVTRLEKNVTVELIMSSKESEKNILDAQGNAAKTVSLAPLSFDEALTGLLATKPPKPAKKEAKAATPETKKPAKKAGKKSSK